MKPHHADDGEGTGSMRWYCRTKNANQEAEKCTVFRHHSSCFGAHLETRCIVIYRLISL